MARDQPVSEDEFEQFTEAVREQHEQIREDLADEGVEIPPLSAVSPGESESETHSSGKSGDAEAEPVDR